MAETSFYRCINRLRRVKEDGKIESDRAFAQRIGVNAQTFLNWKKDGIIPNQKTVDKFCHRLDLAAPLTTFFKELVAGLIEDESLEIEPPQELEQYFMSVAAPPPSGLDTEVLEIWIDCMDVKALVFIPKVRRCMAADESTPRPIGPTEWYAFPLSLLETLTEDTHGLRIVDVDEDFMFPVLKYRDTVIIDIHRREIIGEGIYAFAIGSTIQFGHLRLSPEGGRYIIRPENPSYSQFDIAREAVRVIGKCVYCGRALETMDRLSG